MAWQFGTLAMFGYDVIVADPRDVCTVGNPQHKPFPSTFDGIAREHSRKSTISC
jgi:hypothetical protein